MAKGLCSICYNRQYYNERKDDPEYRQKERERDKKRWAALTKEQRLDKTYRTNYGLSYKEVVALYEKQNGRCAACDTDVELGPANGVVDHCHTSGQVREILCSSCNSALGFVHEDIVKLEKLIAYLRKHKVESIT
jgi:hypothetical protein